MIYLIIETILLIGAIMMIILLSILLGIAEHKIDKAIKYIDTNFCIENRRDLKEVVNILQNGSEVK